MSTEALVDALEQNTPIYLLYLLLSPLQLTKTENNGFETKTTPFFPIGLILGPGISIGNMIVSSTANKNFNTSSTIMLLIMRLIMVRLIII